MPSARPKPVPPSIHGDVPRGIEALGSCLPLAVFTLFFIVGGMMTMLIGTGEVLEARRSKDWVEVPALVVSSELVSSGESTKASIVYTYEFERQSYEFDRYEFLALATDDSYRCRKAVEARPVGAETIAYVDPKAPGRAVLERRLAHGWQWVLVPLLIASVGAVGLLSLLVVGLCRQRRSADGD